MPSNHSTHRTRHSATRMPVHAQNGRRRLPTGRKLRIAYYSHDTMGLGHLRRNLLIAQSLLDSNLPVTNLLITGAHEANLFDMPIGIDCLTLPHWHKMTCGSYRPRALDIASKRLTSLRAGAIQSTLQAYEPDLFIVDKVPRGLFGELEPVLESLANSKTTRCVLGLRDVLDHPQQVQLEWNRDASTEAIERWYDDVWIYGDKTVFDAIKEYELSDSVQKKVTFTGYLDQTKRCQMRWPNKRAFQKEMGLPEGELFACLVGGGQDGFELANAFIDAVSGQKTGCVLLTGPFMPVLQQEKLKLKALRNPNLRVVTFLPEADFLIHAADRIVAMGGYNTVCSALSFNKKSLIVPRISPRREQLVRATCFQELGLIDLLSPEHLSSKAISHWLCQESPHPYPAKEIINMAGLQKLPTLIGERLAR